MTGCAKWQKLGVRDATEGHETDRDWIEFLVNDAAQKRPEDNIPTFDELLVKRRHLLTHRPHTQNNAFEQNIQDPETTRSDPVRQIEIFSKRLYDMHNPEIPALSHMFRQRRTGRQSDREISVTADHLERAQPRELTVCQPVVTGSAASCGSTRRMRLIAASVTVRKVKVHNDRGITMIRENHTAHYAGSVVALQAGARTVAAGQQRH